MVLAAMNYARPGRLIGPSVILEPLRPQHRDLLRAAAAEDESIWTYFPINFNGAGEGFDPWFDYTMDRYANDAHYPFAVRRRADERIVGTTRFYDMVPDHRRLAIGSTWYAPTARGTLINPEVRLLSLTYAFSHLEVNRVEMITDPFNLTSRAAMKLLGAVEEGRMRNHMIYKDGRLRDSVIFSIIRTDWPGVESRLLRKLNYTRCTVILE